MGKNRSFINITDFLVFGIIFIIWLIFAVLTRGLFLSPRNISFIFLQMTIISYISMGMAFVIISGNLDLSVGSLVGLTGAMVAALQVRVIPLFFSDLNVSEVVLTLITVILTLMFGGVLGFWQGLWISYGGVPSIIVTLGGMLLFRGAVLLITKGITLTPMLISLKYLGHGYLDKVYGYIIAIIAIIFLWIKKIIDSRLYKRTHKSVKKGLKLTIVDFLKTIIISIVIILFTITFNFYRGFPIPVVIMMALAIILTFISSKTQFGRYVYAIGGSKEASRLLGIDVKSNQLVIFVLAGIIAAIGGIILTARTDAATTYAGQFYEIEAIAACVIGGVSLFGGRGSVFGALLGALIIAGIDNGMSMLNIEISWQQMIKGMIIIVMVWVDVNFRKKS